MTKEEKITDAYGEYWSDKIDENGWCKLNIKTDRKLLNYMLGNQDLFVNKIEKTLNAYLSFFRPKSLNGIENNNGWIKIESESDLPKESVFWHILTIYPEFRYNIIKAGINPVTNKPYLYDEQNSNYYKIKEITHYQPIIKPGLPIY